MLPHNCKSGNQKRSIAECCTSEQSGSNGGDEVALRKLPKGLSGKRSKKKEEFEKKRQLRILFRRRKCMLYAEGKCKIRTKCKGNGRNL
jgi:hypothetical protein